MVYKGLSSLNLGVAFRLYGLIDFLNSDLDSGIVDKLTIYSF